MTYGYSARLINEINEADRSLLGVRLGRHCVVHNISVTEVSRHLNVSTQTVYNWFRGVSSPTGEAAIRTVEAYLAQSG